MVTESLASTFGLSWTHYLIGREDIKMETSMQNVSPMVQELHRLIGQMSEQNIVAVFNFIKKLQAEDESYNNEQENLQLRRKAFAELLKLREEFAATHPKSLEDERFEAMAEKYPFLREDVRNKG